MLNQHSYPFRIFLSYARLDRELVEQIAARLTEMGLEPLWDPQINPGLAFPDEIKQLISRSHLFMPVITENSTRSAWVHQEIGFALALNLPVLPLSIDGQMAEVMLTTTQALSVRRDLANFAEQLNSANLPQLVVPPPAKPSEVTFIATSSEERAKHIVKYSNWVLGLKKHGLVRVQARFTSFSIPDLDISVPIWDVFEGSRTLSENLRVSLRQERQFLERHALVAGCKLIIDPSASMRSEEARKPRLTVLLDFLRRIPPDNLQVVISSHATDTNLLIVGDYFSAEAMASRNTGYVQTIFNSHPPTVLKRIREFDQLFDEIKSQTTMNSEAVIQHLEGLLQ